MPFYLLSIFFILFNSCMECSAENLPSRCSYYLTDPLHFKIKGRGITQETLKEWNQLSSTATYQETPLLDTVIYSIPKSDELKNFPGISKTSHAIVIAFGGTSSILSSGKLMMNEAASLAKYNVDLISLDYPFHAKGPTEKTYLKTEKALNQFLRIIQHFKKSGKPIYLMGHSFGPLVIQELLYRFPNLVKGAFYFSPSGLTPKLMARFLALIEEVKTKGNSQFPSKINPAGLQFNHAFEQNALSTKNVIQKTSLPIFIVAGDEDAWSVPDEINEAALRYPSAEVRILKGVKHSDIFKYREPGKTERFIPSLITTEISRIQGTPLKPEPIIENSITRAIFLYEHSALFKDWIQSVGLSIHTLKKSEWGAEKIVLEFKNFLKKYEKTNSEN